MSPSSCMCTCRTKASKPGGHPVTARPRAPSSSSRSRHQNLGFTVCRLPSAASSSCASARGLGGSHHMRAQLSHSSLAPRSTPEPEHRACRRARHAPAAGRSWAGCAAGRPGPPRTSAHKGPEVGDKEPHMAGLREAPVAPQTSSVGPKGHALSCPHLAARSRLPACPHEPLSHPAASSPVQPAPCCCST